MAQITETKDLAGKTIQSVKLRAMDGKAQSDYLEILFDDGDFYLIEAVALVKGPHLTSVSVPDEIQLSFMPVGRKTHEQ